MSPVLCCHPYFAVDGKSEKVALLRQGLAVKTRVFLMTAAKKRKKTADFLILNFPNAEPDSLVLTGLLLLLFLHSRTCTSDVPHVLVATKFKFIIHVVLNLVM